VAELFLFLPPYASLVEQSTLDQCLAKLQNSLFFYFWLRLFSVLPDEKHGVFGFFDVDGRLRLLVFSAISTFTGLPSSFERSNHPLLCSLYLDVFPLVR